MDNDSAPRPEFDSLVADLRRARLEKARRDGAIASDQIMVKAMALFREGKLSVEDIARLNSARIRLDESL